MKALTIRQPWAWLIAAGHKDIENRSWSTQTRGLIAIHAASAPAPNYAAVCERIQREFGIVVPTDLPRGGIVGLMEIDGCAQSSNSPWFVGPWGFHIADACELSFVPLAGKLSFWELPDHMVSARHRSPSAVSRS